MCVYFIGEFPTSPYISQARTLYFPYTHTLHKATNLFYFLVLSKTYRTTVAVMRTKVLSLS
jgi:hypothetical protein